MDKTNVCSALPQLSGVTHFIQLMSSLPTKLASFFLHFPAIFSAPSAQEKNLAKLWDLDHKFKHTSDHVAKFHCDHPRELGNVSSKTEDCLELPFWAA